MAAFTFLHVNDFHLGTPRSYRFRPAINRRWAAIKEQMAAINADCLLVGGDVSRDGNTHEFECQQALEDLDSLPFPFHVIPGNMDVGNKHPPGPRQLDDFHYVNSDRLLRFARHFGPINWTFVHKEVRFTGFYTAVAGSGLPEEKTFWEFIERLPDLPRERHHVAVMHYWLYIDSIDEPTWHHTDDYFCWYFSIDAPHRQRVFEALKASGVETLFCGHVHTGRPVEIVDGIHIYKTSSGGNTSQLIDRWPESEMETRYGFHRCDVDDAGIHVAFVPGHDQCEEFGSYGPGGHPSLDERDYSIAAEQPPLSPD